MTQGSLEKFEQFLIEKVTWQKVSVSDLLYDDIMMEMFEQANPVSGLRNSNQKLEDAAYLCNLAALQSPLIVYSFRKHYRILTGVLTHARLRAAIAQNILDEHYEIPVFVLGIKPPLLIRKQIIQFDLTNNLLSKCFVSDTKKISFFLRSWFSKDEGKRSIYQSEEWRTLFPNLNSADKLARYLSISKKDL